MDTSKRGANEAFAPLPPTGYFEKIRKLKEEGNIRILLPKV
jgi:hypothetical protein